MIVREADPLTDTAERLVERLGGAVVVQLPLIGGFMATAPASAVDLLRADSSVVAATPNAELQLSAAGWESSTTLNGMDPKTHPGSLYEVTHYTDARRAWNDGHTGEGIDIALIDSGVVPVNGLTAPGKVINGPDLSFESQNPNLHYLDTFGHGTHLAGIIAGRDDEVTNPYGGAPADDFIGLAPDARIVSIKVADAHGATDVSQVIAAIDWVIRNRQGGDLNIKVLNLAFGTDSVQSYVLDPLAYAVEQAWHAGIVVVVAAGNDGNGYPLRNPALDPYVIAVGAADPNRTHQHGDDTIADFSNCGTADRHVDVIAHGRSITSLRAPGSAIDLEHPDAVVLDRLFVGSGTSQAAAVVSGAVALILSENQDMKPDEVKWRLTKSAQPLGPGAGTLCDGVGRIDAYGAIQLNPPKQQTVTQAHTPSTGAGTLEGARGSDHLEHEGVVLTGEQDIMASPWIGFNKVVTTCERVGKGKYAETVCTDDLVPVATLWEEGDWNGTTWSGVSWSGVSWSGASWSGVSWSGVSWSGVSWSGVSWSDQYWNGVSWSGTTWSGVSWSGVSWSGGGWLSQT